ncbi:MAG: energy-coupling factor transporter ATPase [Oscillospiraceae bacterium]|nr:energy-coupling factor transporter ATPase [Oscillospiraceae bacterium]
MSAILEFEHVSFRYPETKTDSLRDLSLSFEEGTFTAVLGHNGSGKSTLAKHMNGLLTPTSGRVLVSGMDTKEEKNLFRIRQTVGMVFQNPDNQIVSNVVEEDVAFAPENLGIPPEEIRARVNVSLKQVGMYEYRKHAPHLLSGGQKQRVAIAGVLAMQPKVIVLDEPTAMLDPQGREEVIDTINILCRVKKMTVVLITHHMEECIDADRVLVMSEGSVILDGSPAEVFSQVDEMLGAGLDVPETVQMTAALNRAGFCLPEGMLHIEECADAIADAIRDRRS